MSESNYHLRPLYLDDIVLGIDSDKLKAENASLRARLKVYEDTMGVDYWRDDGNPLPTDEQAQRIRREENEACALIADVESQTWSTLAANGFDAGCEAAAHFIAVTIRARFK